MIEERHVVFLYVIGSWKIANVNVWRYQRGRKTDNTMAIKKESKSASNCPQKFYSVLQYQFIDNEKKVKHWI
jgi:hypothetical protein